MQHRISGCLTGIPGKNLSQSPKRFPGSWFSTVMILVSMGCVSNPVLAQPPDLDQCHRVIFQGPRPIEWPTSGAWSGDGQHGQNGGRRGHETDSNAMGPGQGNGALGGGSRRHLPEQSRACETPPRCATDHSVCPIPPERELHRGGQPKGPSRPLESMLTRPLNMFLDATDLVGVPLCWSRLGLLQLCFPLGTGQFGPLASTTFAAKSNFLSVK